MENIERASTAPWIPPGEREIVNAFKTTIKNLDGIVNVLEQVAVHRASSDSEEPPPMIDIRALLEEQTANLFAARNVVVRDAPEEVSDESKAATVKNVKDTKRIIYFFFLPMALLALGSLLTVILTLNDNARAQLEKDNATECQNALIIWAYSGSILEDKIQLCSQEIQDTVREKR